MPLVVGKLASRSSIFNPGIPSHEFSQQWTHPGDVFSVLLLLGGDVVERALAQLAGGRVAPPSFSFGWVAYSIIALVSAVGENKLMPMPDCACIAINGKSGYARSNSSWVLGRMVRDYDSWMEGGVKDMVTKVVERKWGQLKDEARRNNEPVPERPKQAGLCVSIYRASSTMKAGKPVYDGVYLCGFFIAIFQLGIAAIPCGVFGDWGILMITISGIVLSFITANLPQWGKEKWACRRLRGESNKKIVLTRGNGSQHAIIVLGSPGSLDLEDLAGGQTNVDVATSVTTRVSIAGLALLWILLLITAAGIKTNTWFLLAVGGIGILQNVFVAGWKRKPGAFGIQLEYVTVFGDVKGMETLYQVEEAYPYLGRSIRETFFPGNLRPAEEDRWNQYETTARDREAAIRAAAQSTAAQNTAAQNLAAQNART